MARIPRHQSYPAMINSWYLAPQARKSDDQDTCHRALRMEIADHRPIIQYLAHHRARKIISAYTTHRAWKSLTRLENHSRSKGIKMSVPDNGPGSRQSQRTLDQANVDDHATAVCPPSQCVRPHIPAVNRFKQPPTVVFYGPP